MKADTGSARVPYADFYYTRAFLSLASMVSFLYSGSLLGKPSAKQGTFGEHVITMLTVTELCGQSPQEA